MNQFQTERRLCWCYGFLSILLSVAVICIAIPYQHWRATLDVCPGSWLENTNCGCILFGANTHQHFMGGHNSYCLFAILAPLPLIVYALVMVIFHMYRVCINNIGQYEDEKTAAMEEIEGESIVVTTRTRVSHKNDAVIYCWIPSASLSTIFCIYNLVYASIITHGYLKTCTQYRSNVAKVLGAAGNQASAIHFRLSCQAIFDYMDYIQYNSLNVRRDEVINTGVALQIALFAIWCSVCIWAAVSFYTVIRAYKERDVLTCCGK